MTDEPRVILEREGPVATLMLNRPTKLNAIDLAMLDALDAAAAELEVDRDVRVVLLTAAGERAFCVGADISAWSAMEPLDVWRTLIPRGHQVFGRIARLPQPVIAVLSGSVFGGGLELALHADLRVAAEGVEMALPEVGLGIVPGWGGTQRLTALVGLGRAKWMILSGNRVDATTAERWGLVQEVASAAELPDRVSALAGAIAGRAPLAVAFAKQLLEGGVGRDTGTTLERLASGLALSTEDGREGPSAFLERRPPSFGGR